MNLDEYRENKRKEIKDAKDLERDERLKSQMKREKHQESMKEIQHQINTLIYQLEKKDYINIETVSEDFFKITLRVDDDNYEYYDLSFIPISEDDGNVKGILINLRYELTGNELQSHAKRQEFLELKNLDIVIGRLVSGLNENLG